MLRLKSAILLSVPSVSVSLFKPYCELFECFLGFHFDLFVAFFFFFKKTPHPSWGSNSQPQNQESYAPQPARCPCSVFKYIV